MKVSVGPPYFTPMSAIFAVPMLVVAMVGPLLRWRRDKIARVRGVLLLPLVAMVLAAVLVGLHGGVALMPFIGLVLASGLALASVLPLRGRKLAHVPLNVWGMVVAHFGIAVALAGMACDSAFSVQRLVAARVGESVMVGPWAVRLAGVAPVAGQNWTALEGNLVASRGSDASVHLAPQSRSFWAPVQTTSVSALHTVWDGQLYTVLGDEVADDAGDMPTPASDLAHSRWQLRLWWKPFVPLIWAGGALVALGGALALLGRLATDLRRYVARGKIVDRKQRQALARGERA